MSKRKKNPKSPKKQSVPKKQGGKTWILCAAAILLLGVIGLTVWLALRSRGESTVYRAGDYQFTLRAEGEAVIVAYVGEETRLTIPSTLAGHPVTAIGPYAFYEKTFLREVVIPESVTEIGYQAFACCDKLADMTIPDGVNSVGNCAWIGTPWLERHPDSFVVVGQGILVGYRGTERCVTLPAGVRCVSTAFFDCGTVEEVILPEGVAEIGELAFYGAAALEKITLPSTLRSVGKGAFAECTALKEVKCEGGETQRKEMTIGVNNEAFCAALARETAEPA